MISRFEAAVHQRNFADEAMLHTAPAQGWQDRRRKVPVLGRRVRASCQKSHIACMTWIAQHRSPLISLAHIWQVTCLCPLPITSSAPTHSHLKQVCIVQPLQISYIFSTFPGTIVKSGITPSLPHPESKAFKSKSSLYCS